MLPNLQTMLRDAQVRRPPGFHPGGSIIGFLCRNGAYIAETYRTGLGGKQREAFLRVVKAELVICRHVRAGQPPLGQPQERPPDDPAVQRRVQDLLVGVKG